MRRWSITVAVCALGLTVWGLRPSDESLRVQRLEAPTESSSEVDAAAVEKAASAEQEFFSAYFSELDEQIAREGQDAEQTRRVQAACGGGPEGLGQRVQVVCSQTLCRVESQHESAAERQAFAQSLLHLRAAGLGSGSIHSVPGTLTLVGFLARQPSRLPKPTAPLAAFVSQADGR